MALRYNVEGLREEIRWALVSAPRTRGQLDGIEANGISDRRLQKKGKHLIMDDDGNELALVESEVVRTIACRQYKTSIDPISSDAFRSARLIRTIRTNSTHVADWLLYCYNEKPALPSVELLSQLLYQFYEEEQRSVNEKSKELIKHMALLACQQKRIERNSATDLLTEVEVSRLSGKNHTTWRNTWSARWKRLLSILEQFDREGLDHVYQSGRSRSSTREHAYVSLQ